MINFFVFFTGMWGVLVAFMATKSMVLNYLSDSVFVFDARIIYGLSSLALCLGLIYRKKWAAVILSIFPLFLYILSLFDINNPQEIPLIFIIYSLLWVAFFMFYFVKMKNWSKFK